MAHDVFISYSSQDKTVADAVCAKLESRKIRCWIAPRDILPGMSFAEALIEALNQSRLMVLVFSTSSNNSQQVMREVERAVNKGIPIIPFRIEDVTPTKAMEYYLSSPHWLDAMTPPLERHLDRLADSVEKLLENDLGKVQAKEAITSEQKPPIQINRPKKKRNSYIIASAIVAAALIIAGVLFLPKLSGNQSYTTKIPKSMVAYWKFDEGSGSTIHDSTGKGNDGIIPQNGPIWTTGKAGTALQFDGDNTMIVTFPKTKSLDTSKDLTVEFWVKLAPNQPGQLFTIIDKQHDVSTGWFFQSGSDKNQIVFGHKDTGVASTTGIADNVWHHVAATFDGTAMKMYIDGLYNSFSLTDAPITQNNRPIEIGGFWNGGRNIIGLLDEVAIYNTALSGTEIQQHYKYSSVGLSYYPGS